MTLSRHFLFGEEERSELRGRSAKSRHSIMTGATLRRPYAFRAIAFLWQRLLKGFHQH
jgi:hypothetical protein